MQKQHSPLQFMDSVRKGWKPEHAKRPQKTPDLIPGENPKARKRKLLANALRTDP